MSSVHTLGTDFHSSAFPPTTYANWRSSKSNSRCGHRWPWLKAINKSMRTAAELVRTFEEITAPLQNPNGAIEAA